MVERIAVIKTGWSDDFQGAEVEGDHKHVRERGFGHEKYNFMAAPDGTYCIYIPPIKKHFAPNPKQKTDWLIFHVAKRPKLTGLYLIGWYENAEFVGGYEERPEYKRKGNRLELDNDGEPFSYTIRSRQAVQLNQLEAKHLFPGDHMKRSPIFYLRGDDRNEPWRNNLAKKLFAIRASTVDNASPKDGAASNRKGGGICADPARRKEVEEAAIAMVKKRFPEKTYEVHDRQSDKCGYDILVRRKSDPKDELHIEVKGTQMNRPHFLMSKNEYAYMFAHPDQWRLGMVTDALKSKPKLKLYEASEAQREFNWEEFTWHVTSKKMTNGTAK